MKSKRYQRTPVLANLWLPNMDDIYSPGVSAQGTNQIGNSEVAELLLSREKGHYILHRVAVATYCE